MAVTIGIGELSRSGVVIETSGGTKYAVFIDDGHLFEIHKNIDGIPSEVYHVNSAVVVHGGTADSSRSAWIAGALDSSDKIHLISVTVGDEYGARNVAYGVFDTSDDTLSTAWEEVSEYDQDAPINPGCAISLDSSDKPHVLFVDLVKSGGNNGDNVYYMEKTGASWASYTQIGLRDTKTDRYDHPTITLRNSDYIEAFYYFSVGAGDPAYRTYTASWSGESVYTETTATIGFGGVTSTTGGTVYRYHADDAEDIEENNVDTTYNADTTSNRISVSLVSSDRYIFYIDTSDDVHLISNDGSWSDEGALQAGTYTYVIAEWAYNNENQSGEINYIFDDGTNVYYDSFDLAGDYTVSETDGITIGESVTVALGDLTLSVSDGITVGEDVTVDPPATPSEPDREIDVDDGLTIGEAVDLAFDDLAVSESDDITIGDTPALVQDDKAVDISDGITVGEDTNLNIELEISETDGLTVGESTDVELPDALAIDETDDIAIGESTTVEATRTLDVSDDITIGESTDAELPDALAIDVSDGITIGDTPDLAHDDEVISVSDDVVIGEANIELAIGALEARTIDVSDGITLGEDTSVAHDDMVVSTASSITIGETTTAAHDDEIISVSDGITLGEDTTVSRQDAATREIDVSDDITIGENVTASLPDDLVFSVSDDLTLGEDTTVNVEVEGEYNLSVSDGITIGESTTAKHDDESIDVSDDVAVGENVETAQESYLSVSDNVTITDIPRFFPDNIYIGEYVEVQVVDVSVDRDISVSDDITIGENVTTSLDDLTFSVTDSLTIGEDTILNIVLEISVSDDVVIADTPNVEIGAFPVRIISVTDDITLGESTSVTVATSEISVTDGIAVGDNVTTSIDLEMVLSDSITIADAVQGVIYVAIIKDWTLNSRATDWTIEDRDLDWDLFTRGTAWTIDDRDMDWSIQDRDTAWTVEDR